MKSEIIQSVAVKLQCNPNAIRVQLQQVVAQLRPARQAPDQFQLLRPCRVRRFSNTQRIGSALIPRNTQLGTSIRLETLDSSSNSVDFYELLSVSKDASLAEIKSAYHRALLESHPDKRNTSTSSDHVDIALLKEAYTTLSADESRTAYNAHLRQRVYTKAAPRPAQVISLEEFEEENTSDTEDDGPWKYLCRCGGLYRITTILMEKGEHLIACNSCSETIWVGYEVLES